MEAFHVSVRSPFECGPMLPERLAAGTREMRMHVCMCRQGKSIETKIKVFFFFFFFPFCREAMYCADAVVVTRFVLPTPHVGWHKLTRAIAPTTGQGRDRTGIRSRSPFPFRRLCRKYDTSNLLARWYYCIIPSRGAKPSHSVADPDPIRPLCTPARARRPSLSCSL